MRIMRHMHGTVLLSSVLWFIQLDWVAAIADSTLNVDSALPSVQCPYASCLYSKTLPPLAQTCSIRQPALASPSMLYYTVSHVIRYLLVLVMLRDGQPCDFLTAPARSSCGHDATASQQLICCIGSFMKLSDGCLVAMRRSGFQRTAFNPNNILVDGSMNLLDCDNPNYRATSPYTINAPPLGFDITCGSNAYGVRLQCLGCHSMHVCY